MALRLLIPEEVAPTGLRSERVLDIEMILEMYSLMYHQRLPHTLF